MDFSEKDPFFKRLLSPNPIPRVPGLNPKTAPWGIARGDFCEEACAEAHILFDTLDPANTYLFLEAPFKCTKPLLQGMRLEIFFFSNFSGNPGTPRQNPGISRQKVWFPWASKDIANFLAPTPTRRYPDQKVWVWIPFSSLILIAHPFLLLFYLSGFARISKKGPTTIPLETYANTFGASDFRNPALSPPNLPNLAPRLRRRPTSFERAFCVSNKFWLGVSL